ncbi:hypothetical protein AMK21_30225 [Streptomyces sp. CB00316]|nr:hypothetical protein AMK21_30225 [Streptomyces sp. CB00316]
MSEGRFGLLVHHDRGAVVLTPQIHFAKPDRLIQIVQKEVETEGSGDLKAAALEAATNSTFDGSYGAALGSEWISHPMVIADPEAAHRTQTILAYYE